MYRINKLDKKSILLKQSRKLFHTNDLALLWGITNKNTLYTTIKRYIKKGVLISIHKGLYSLVPLSQLDSIEVGIAFLHTYTYVSCETVLAREGIILQSIPAITLISSISKNFIIGNNSFKVRQIKKNYLYNNAGIIDKKPYQEATVERAVADLLYYNPHYYFDNQKRIDWPKVHRIQKEVGFV